MNVHNVFSPDCLRKAANNPLPGQLNKPPPLVVVTGDMEYKVKEVLAVRKLCGCLLYQVKWLGYNKDLEWYPVLDLKTAPHKLQDFYLNNPT